ncbi:protein O-mannosyl-transferase TMTC2-like [Daphnia carinata]|uniref:protein O-mannosyl-transferase TMTC2-like n=1 Tax=Daphnia carinata TaxID=120202 RepID=UPI00257E2637|nr:protein O-mannosyl-transferase TMTC2-like [Daphnia carinata]
MEANISGFVCCLVAALLFANTWQGDFVYDDSRAIVSNEDLRPSSSWLDLWRHDFWGTPLDHAGSHQSWRPLCVLSFRLNYSWSGLNPKSYHIVNIVLHSLVTLCLTLLVQPIIRRRWVRWIVSLAFAVHPIHCEAVASIVGRAELGAALHTLVALLAYRAHLKARGRRRRRRYQENKEATSNTKEDRQQQENEEEEDEERQGKKRKRIEPLIESTRARRNPFQRRQSPLSLFIRRVTICCCWSHPLKKIQYRVTSPTSASNNVHKRDQQHGRHHQPDDDELSGNRWRSNDKKKTKKDEPQIKKSFGCCAYLWTSLAAAALAILWKETGMVAIPLCAVMELTQHFQVGPSRRQLPSNRQSSDRNNRHLVQERGENKKTMAYRNLSLLGAVWAGQLGLRMYMLGGESTTALPWFAAADNPVSRDASLLTRTLTFLHLPAFNFGLLLWPAWLSFDWSMDSISPVTRFNDARNVATFIFYAGLAVLVTKTLNRLKQQDGHRKHTKLIVTALSFLVLPFLPATNLFFYVGFVVAERVLYMPSIGFCLLLGAGLEKTMDLTQSKKCGSIKREKFIRLMLATCFGATLIMWSVRTFQRNGDWSSEEQLYRSGIPINPAKAYGNLAAILAREQRQTEAEHAYRQALAHRPNMAETHFNLALLLQSQGRHQEASSSYLQSIHYRPNLAAAYLNLGLLLSKQQGQHELAVHWLSACSQLDGSGVRDPQAHRHSQIQALVSWGQLELASGHPETSIQLYKQAIRRTPTNLQQVQLVYHSLAEAYQSVGNYLESERWFKAAVDQVQESHSIEQQQANARQQYKRTMKTASSGSDGLQTSRSDQVAAHLTYARFLAKNASRHDEAEQLFRQAQLMAPTDPAVYMFTGQFLLEASRPREAAEFFVRAAHLAPADFEAVFNAATTLREVKELDRAELFYRKAVQLRPDDVTVYRNLGALLHVKGQWREAEDNYQLALRLVPNDRITLTNLNRLHQLVAGRSKSQPNVNNNSSPLTPQQATATTES